ncbi:hypothetical protein MMC06_005663, partial [Schaereria dolodes]|nr:hypothetical protein [Schaereria dolodes]
MRPALRRLLLRRTEPVPLNRILKSPTVWIRGARHVKCGFEIRGTEFRRNATLVASDHATVDRALAVLGSFNISHQESLKIRRWRERLNTFEQFELESDLDRTFNEGSRLVDDVRYCGDCQLWLELLRFRRRNYGVEGLTPIWNGMKRKDITLPTYGATAYEIWDNLLDLAFENSEVMKDLWQEAKRLKVSTGNSWPYLYLKILGHFLKSQPAQAYTWHSRLKKDFPPSPRLLKKLFGKIVGTEVALQVFKRIYIELAIRDMYDVIVSTFCENEMYAMALKWHNLLIRLNDLPSSSIVAQPLLHHLAVYGHEGQLMKLTKGMVDAGVSFARYIDTSVKQNTLISREMMNRLHGESHNITPKGFNDEFCARLFATRMFSVDMVINGLRVLGVELIGPLSLRQIASRSKKNEVIDPRSVVQYIERLHQAGISIGTSVFSRLVAKLATSDQRNVLNDVITCDLHPEAFEDWKLQETLLASFEKSGDQRQVIRTLAILMVDARKDNEQIVRWNLLLRSCLTRQDWKGTSQTIGKMFEKNIPMTAKTNGYVRICLLSRRQASRKPSTIDDLPRVISIWQGSLRLGGKLQPLAWVEVLRRLGMSGHLQEYESLALWLVAWYSDPVFRASQTGLTSQRRIADSVGAKIHKNLSKHHALHPLRLIFSANMQEAMVAWGFQATGMGDSAHKQNTQLALPADPIHAPWTWGLKMIAKLQACGVSMDRTKVASSCRKRLLALFGPGTSNRLVNRRVK